MLMGNSSCVAFGVTGSSEDKSLQVASSFSKSDSLRHVLNAVR